MASTTIPYASRGGQLIEENIITQPSGEITLYTATKPCRIIIASGRALKLNVNGSANSVDSVLFHFDFQNSMSTLPFMDYANQNNAKQRFQKFIQYNIQSLAENVVSIELGAGDYIKTISSNTDVYYKVYEL